MGKNKLKIDFSGFEKYYEKFDELNKEVKTVTEDALKASFDIVTPAARSAIKKHRRTGKTENSLQTSPNVQWQGNRAFTEVGFDIKNGGLPSIFLMYGTPRHMAKLPSGRRLSVSGVTQDKSLYNAFYGTATKRKIWEKQKEIFDDALRKALQ